MARAAKKKNTHEPDLKAFFDYLNEVSTEKGLSRDEVVETFKGSLITAYQRKYGVDANLEVIMDRETPEIAVICRRKVLDPVLNPAQEISTAEAQKIQPGIKEGEVLEVRENPFEFSRIGATNVRQILLQRLKELEREILYNDFKAREGDLVNGYFLRWRDKDLMYIDLGKLEGVMPRREQIPNEKFRPGDRVKAVIKLVELRREKSREPGPFVTLSRASGDFVKKLFEMEIPEIYDGVVEISGIARYAGYRTKILVRSNRMDVDPVGACVGVRGVRIQSVVRELGNERIDIVNDTGNVSDIIASAMSPATVTEVRVDPSTREALVLVPDDQQSKAIGNGGQNVRLASQLSGYKLTVKTLSQFNEEMASPEARARLEQLFSQAPAEPEEEYTPLVELPDLSPRINSLLEAAGIKSVEQLVEASKEDLERILGEATARHVQRIVAEVVEVTE
jgi:N utilization substance protein A